jgi:hypothetical protein
MAEASVDSTHSEYNDAAPKWAKCRAAAAGEEAVHAAGVTFLPKLTGQTPEEYDAYRARALYYNATGRTVDGLSGLIFRRPPTFTIPEAVSYLEKDVDTADTPLLGFSERVVDELLQVGRIGILADYPRMAGAQTLADQRAANGRPYLKTYSAESILNWRVERVNNRSMLTLVVLSEVHEEPAGFATSSTPQCRVLKLEGGIYGVEIWRKLKDAEGKEAWVLVEGPLTPLMGGKALNYIPFLVCGPMGLDPCVAKPPILDLANVNLSHYRSSADYEHGLHFTGLPTPIVTGHAFDVDEQGRPKNTFPLGSSTIQAFGNPQAKVSFLEFTGTGLGALSKRMEEKEKMMAALGARLLAAEKRTAETAETAAIHRSGENGVLASLALAASSAISKACGWCAEWEGVGEVPSVELNTDYLPAGITAQELSELVKTWQAGAISHETLYDNLQRAEIAQQGETFEDEKARIDAEGPALGDMGAGNPPTPTPTPSPKKRKLTIIRDGNTLTAQED